MLKVTTPIFYVNAKPHLGHAYTMVLADTFARYQKLMGKDVILTTGCDEHGSKVQQAALKSNLAEQEYCNSMSSNFVDLAKKLNINYSHFTRTTDDSHKKRVQEMWQQMVQADDIYKGTFKGWYSLADEAFYRTSDIQQINGQYFAKETNSQVHLVEEENYMFRLSKYKDAIQGYLNGLAIVPESRRNDIDNWLNKLEDISVSRPKSKVSWGIPVPGDESHTIYVWLDALLGYLEPDTTSMVHFVGKDILKFHAVIWPAFCSSLNITYPARIFAHGHWTVKGSKMSKSIGNGVCPHELLCTYDVDAFRYCLLRMSKLGDDADFDPLAFLNVYNTELVNQLGNLASRCTSPKLLPHFTESSSDRDVIFDESNVAKHYEKGDFHLGLDSIMNVIREGNRIFFESQPWKSPDPKTTLRDAKSRLMFAAKWLSPVMPGKMETLKQLIEDPRPGLLLFPRIHLQRQSVVEDKDAKVLL